MSIVLSNILKAQTFFAKRPLVKGIASFAVIWPTGCLLQQRIEGKKWGTYDWKRCVRFGIYGGLYVAPMLYGWVRFTSVMWPKTNFRSGLAKALIDSASFGPTILISFYFGMNMLEFKTLQDAIDECKQKFIPTYKVYVSLWPILHTINFSLIPERNRVVFASICSVFWTIFLAHMHMKHLEKEKSETDYVEEMAS